MAARQVAPARDVKSRRQETGNAVADSCLVFSLVATLARAWNDDGAAADNRPPSGEGRYEIHYGGESGVPRGWAQRTVLPTPSSNSEFETLLPKSACRSKLQTTRFVFGSSSISKGCPGPA